MNKFNYLIVNMTDKEKVFSMFDSPDTSNHYVAWQLCKGMGISIDEVIDYKLNTRNGWILTKYTYSNSLFNLIIKYVFGDNYMVMFRVTDVNKDHFGLSIFSITDSFTKSIKAYLSKDIIGGELNE